MAKILKADASAADAYVEANFSTAGDPWYVQFEFWIPSSTMAALSSLEYSAKIVDPNGDALFLTGDGTDGSAHNFSDGNTNYWTDHAPGNPAAGGFTADAWHTVKISHVAGTITWNIDTVDVLSYSQLVTFSGLLVGARSANHVAGEVYYIRNVKAGTTVGGTDVFADDFSSGDTSAWTTTTGDATVVDEASLETFTGPVRVGVAFNDVALEPSPTWTYLNDGSSRVASYTIERGRQFEFDKTDAGTATVSVNDRDGTLDPTNSAGPFFGLIEPLLQIKIDLWNPVALEYQTRFRGWIEDFTYLVEPFTHQDALNNTVGLTRLEIQCVDIFEILTAIEMQPDGSFGDDPATATYADATGNIFFAVIDGQGRIDQVMGNAGVDPAFYVAFTLNIDCSEAVYSPSENVLQVIQDVADAEFPTVANAYTDRFGRLAVHGRLAKFDPATTAASAAAGAWDFTHWKAGDGKAVAASPTDTAHIRSFSYNRGLSMIRNSALCTPNHIDDPETTPGTSDIPGQYVTDLASIGQYGIRSWSAENLFVEDGTLTGNNKLDECKAFASFVVANYAEPRNRITEITFKSIHPAAEGAAANWDFLCRVDISDLVDVTIRGPGDSDTGYIFNAESFFVEGVHEEARPATGGFAMVTTSLDLSPQAYFSFAAPVTPVPGGSPDTPAVSITGATVEGETLTAVIG